MVEREKHENMRYRHWYREVSILSHASDWNYFSSSGQSSRAFRRPCLRRRCWCFEVFEAVISDFFWSSAISDAPVTSDVGDGGFVSVLRFFLVESNLTGASAGGRQVSLSDIFGISDCLDDLIPCFVLPTMSMQNFPLIWSRSSASMAPYFSGSTDTAWNKK